MPICVIDSFESSISVLIEINYLLLICGEFEKKNTEGLMLIAWKAK